MRVAFFIYGEYRQFDYTFHFFNELISKFDCDVYISTWNYSEQVHETYNIDIRKIIIEEEIQSKIKNSIIKVSDVFEFNKKNKYTSSLAKQIYHFKTCLNLYKLNEKEVDYIFLLRIDSIYKFDSNILSDLKKDTLYTSSNIKKISKGTFHIDDNYFIGSPKLFETFFDKLLITTNYNSHKEWSDVIIRNKIKTKFYEIPFVCVRPNMISFFEQKKYSLDDFDKINYVLSDKKFWWIK